MVYILINVKKKKKPKAFVFFALLVITFMAFIVFNYIDLPAHSVYFNNAQCFLAYTITIRNKYFYIRINVHTYSYTKKAVLFYYFILYVNRFRFKAMEGVSGIHPDIELT